MNEGPNLRDYMPTLWLDAWPNRRGAHARAPEEPVVSGDADSGSGLEHRDPAPADGFNPALKRAIKRQLDADFHSRSLAKATGIEVPSAVVTAARNGDETAVDAAFSVEKAVRTGTGSI